jgi:hypothetical protein
VILSPGDSLGAYTILGVQGAGGMGEVYRARDTRLGRDVALKVLARDAAKEPGRVDRFEVEARAASALNHPSIVVVYEVGAGVPPGGGEPLRFLAMEYLDGEPLSSRIPRGGLPLREALTLAVDLADGLARAHESGILHRDLKPSNLYVTRDGRLKILDFGLAKLRREPGDPSPASTTDTLTSPGTLVGTVGYLSPEQLRGEPATAASDQFSAGCVLYEMLSGRRAFTGSTSAEVASAILRDEPLPLDSLRTGLPPPLVWVVERCLAKSPRERYAATSDFARDLRTLKEHSGEVVRSSSPSGVRARPVRATLRAGAFAVALLIGGAALAAVALLLRAPKPAPEFRRLTFRDGSVWKALFEPRSASIVYSAAWDGDPARLYRTAPQVAGLDRPLEGPGVLPFAFDPDGARILGLQGAGRPAVNLAGTLVWLPGPGGTPRPFAENYGWADVRGDVVVAVRDAGESRVLEVLDARGQKVRELFSTSGALSWVRLSPDARSVAFFHHPWRYDDGGEVVSASVDGSGRRTLAPGLGHTSGLDWNARTGEVWFTATSAQDAGGTLWAAAPRGRLRVVHRGLQFFVLQSVRGEERRALFTLGDSRASLFVRRRGEPLRNLSWLGWSLICDVSPDGRTLLFNESGSGAGGTFVRPVDGSGTAVPLGSLDGLRFSPDGKFVVGLAGRGRDDQQVVVAPVGPGPVRALTSGPASWDDAVWAGPDRLLARRQDSNSEAHLVLLSTAGGAEVDLGRSECRMPAVSPAGMRVACLAAAGSRRIFLQPLDAKAAATDVFSLPDGEERLARVSWSSDGGRLFSVTTAFRLLTIDAATGRLLGEEQLPLPPGSNRLLGAAVSGDGALAVYSSARETSALYVGDGLE